MMKTIISKIGIKTSLALLVASEVFAASDTSHGDSYGDAAHAAHDAAGHAADHSSGGLPQLDPTYFASQLFWLIITFVTLYFIFSKKILPELSSTIESRHERVQGDLAEAEKLKEEAERVQQAYEESLVEARSKATDAMINAEQKIKEKMAKSMDKFREKSMEKTQETEKSVTKAKKAAMKDMDSIAAEIASEAAEKIVGVRADIKKAKSVVENISKKAA